jgi:uncharacterized protein
MNCPRCLVPMTDATIDAAGVNVAAKDCAKCTGHFIALADLKVVEAVVDIRLLKWRNLPGIETQGRVLFCPRCPGIKPMDKIVSERDQRVVMDVCHTCDGVWLDRGELESIQQRGILGALADVVDFLRRA